MLGKFFDNVRKMRDAGCSFTIEATPSDELIPYIDEMMQVCVDNIGAVNHVTVARDEHKVVEKELPILTKMSREKYYRIWSVFDSNFFAYKMKIFGQKRKEFCYAGEWSLRVNLATGEATQCYCTYFKQNIFKDLNNPIIFRPIGNNCKQVHCHNGHAFLVLGLIPELETPTYGEIRNRKCNDGSEWLQPAMKSFMNTRLYESNKLFNDKEKRLANLYIQYRKFVTFIERVVNKFKKAFK